MKKERGLLCIFLILSIAFCSLALAADSNLSAKEKGYQCIEDKLTDTPCSDSQMSTETKLFVFLATGKCQSEIEKELKNDECWPELPNTPSCTLKSTSQAILFLDERNKDYGDAEDWLLNRTISPSNLIWYLQIETYGEDSTCTASYDSGSDSLKINKDYTVDVVSGSCLSVPSDSEYRFEIKPSCLNKEFQVSCNNAKGFLTNLLFKKSGSQTIYVAEESQSSNTGTASIEKVNSLCFSLGSTCDYEGSLWATLAIDSLGDEIYAYMPYLIATAEDNPEYFPDAFLYRLTGYENYISNVKAKQFIDGHWAISSNKYFDTALALYLDYSSSSQATPTATKSWLEKEQLTSGCWNNDNLRDTAFILYQVWGPGSPITPDCDTTGTCPDDEKDCEDSNAYCSNGFDCTDAGGSILTYDCSGGLKCCSINPIKTCSQLGGKICEYGEECDGDEENEASDIYSGETCCIGTCKESVKEDLCEKAKGTCKSSCDTKKEKESSTGAGSCESTQKCCVALSDKDNKKESIFSKWYVLILIILIILTIMGIVFRDRLEPYYDRFFRGGGSGGGRGKPSSPSGPSFSLPSLSRTFSPPRSILPPSSRPSMPRRAPASSSSSQVDDVLKKLREIGK